MLAGHRLPLDHPEPGGRDASVNIRSLYSTRRAQRGDPTAIHTRQLEPCLLKCRDQHVLFFKPEFNFFF